MARRLLASCASRATLGLLLFFGRNAASEEEVVVVHGSKAPGSVREPEVSVGVVKGEQLREPGVDAGDALSRAPGVQVTRSGSSADLVTVSIRGAEASQIPVYLAGIRINDDVAGVADLSRLPLWMMQRVEIYRGAGPLHAGRGGMAGAVLFEPTLPREPSYRLGADAGSFGTGALWLGATMTHPGQVEDWATSVAVKRSGARNDFEFPSDEGTAFSSSDDENQVRQNADFSESDVWIISRGRLSVGDRSASVTALYNHFTREQGVSGLSLIPAKAARSELNRDLGGVSSRVSCSLLRSCTLETATAYQATNLATFDPDGELNLGALAVDQQSRRASQDIRLIVEPTEQLELSWGISAELSQLNLDTPETTLARASETFVGVSSGLRYAPRPDRFVRFALSAQCAEAQGSTEGVGGQQRREMTWTQCQPEGRIGGVKEFSDAGGASVARLRALVHAGVRYPTLGQRFGVSAVTRGNQSLGVERAFSVDLGGTWTPAPRRWGSYFIDASVYQRHAQDLIAYRRSSLGYVRPFNVGSARFIGGEISGEISAFEHVRHRTTVTLLDPRDTTEGRTTENDLLVHRSQITASEELEVYRMSEASTVTYAGLSAYFTYRSGRVADPAGLIIIPQQGVFDLGGRLEFIRQIDLRARLENVLGTARYDSLGFPLPGRSVFLSMEIASP